ncbi:unnamed protein product [Moneuplotes crassus]|uniref:tRNA-binding domain-containing protein n=1 Tax=Euplotes crassus TaxID=5936 RepID=A0AAD1UL02_EUPCR|nr:unnamed protein product [Moneuplotes crassus]
MQNRNKKYQGEMESAYRYSSIHSIFHNSVRTLDTKDMIRTIICRKNKLYLFSKHIADFVTSSAQLTKLGLFSTKMSSIAYQASLDACTSTQLNSDSKKKMSKNKSEKRANKGPKKPKKNKGQVDYTAPPITLVDIRVGQITKVSKHPDSDKLYLEEIDIGEAEPRFIVSGLQQFVPIDQMENAMVCVAANLKTRKLGGYPSQGMVLCATSEDFTSVELLTPPKGAKPGDIVKFEGVEHNAPPQLNPKKKIFEKVQKDFKVDSNGIAYYKDLEWKHENGPFTATTIKNGLIC